MTLIIFLHFLFSLSKWILSINVRHSLKFELRIGLEKEYIDINITGNTPLHEAVRRGKTETVAVLIRHGADLTVKNNEGNTALHMVLDSYADEIDEGESDEAQVYREIAGLLIKAGTSPNIRNQAGKLK